MPYFESSRPTPLSFMLPNGAISVEMMLSFPRISCRGTPHFLRWARGRCAACWRGSLGRDSRLPGRTGQFRRDSQLCADDLGIPRDRDLDANTQASFGQGQQQRLQEHPNAEGVGWAEVPVHADNAGQRRAKELPVAQDCGRMFRLVLVSDSHRPVDLRAQLAAKVLEPRGQGGILGGRRWASSSRAATRRSRDASDANTICHGWMLEFDGADWARARASVTNSRGTGCGKNIRVEWRSLIA